MVVNKPNKQAEKLQRQIDRLHDRIVLQKAMLALTQDWTERTAIEANIASEWVKINLLTIKKANVETETPWYGDLSP